jgi:lipoate-protein ligase A
MPLAIQTMLARLLHDSPADGVLNMAVDEALLESAALANQLSLRFYRWSQPTLSLGYFQHYEDRRLHPASLRCDCVRRSSGGGAILHDRELTYSLAVPASHPLARSPEELYTLMHQSLVECLRGLGFKATLVSATTIADPAPFLCFQRYVSGDVIVGNHKVAGSAQRRWRGAVLQHGSVLIERSPAAPELPGLGDLVQTPGSIDKLLICWQSLLPAALADRYDRGKLTNDERSRAGEIASSKYSQSAWMHRR